MSHFSLNTVVHINLMMHKFLDLQYLLVGITYLWRHYVCPLHIYEMNFIPRGLLLKGFMNYPLWRTKSCTSLLSSLWWLINCMYGIFSLLLLHFFLFKKIKTSYLSKRLYLSSWTYYTKLKSNIFVLNVYENSPVMIVLHNDMNKHILSLMLK